MPLKPLGSLPAIPAPKAEPSFMERLKGWAPSIVRGGAGLVSSLAADEPGLGTLLGGGVNALGETVAEGMEGSPLNLKRIAAEGALGMVPMGKIMPAAGTMTRAAVGGGALAATGEGAREYTTSGELDPSRIGESALVGGVTAGALNGLLGKFFGTKSAPTSSAPDLEVQPTAHTGPGTFETRFGANGKVINRAPSKPIPTPRGIDRLGEVPPGVPPISTGTTSTVRTAYNIPDAPIATNPSFIVGRSGEVADARNVPEGQYSKFANWMAKRDTDAAKATAEANKAQAIRDEITLQGLKQGKPSISLSDSAQTPDGRLSIRTPFKAPEPDKGDVDALAGMLDGGEKSQSFDPISHDGGVVIPPEGPARDIYLAWLSKGASHENALSNAAAGIAPRGSNIMRPGSVKVTQAPVVPEAVAAQQPPHGRSPVSADPVTAPGAAPVPAEAVSAVPAYKDPLNGLDYYHVHGGPSHGSTVSAAKLAELGIPVSEGEVPVPVRPGTPAVDTAPDAISAPESPDVAEPQSPLARFFKSRVDAAGQGYGDIKAAKAAGEAVPQEGYTIAGQAARRERQAAGLPAPSRASRVATASAPAPVVDPVEALGATYTPDELIAAGTQSGKLDELARLLKAQPQEPPALAEGFGPPPGTPEPPAEGVSNFKRMMREKGFSDDQIDNMSVEEAAQHLQPPADPNDMASMIQALRKKGFTDADIASMSREQADAHLNPPVPPVAQPAGPKLRKRGGILDESGGNNERGAIDPALVNFLTRAGVGGLVGGAVGGHYGHPFAGALLGAGGAGLLTPNVSRVIPAASEAASRSQEGFATAGDIANKLHNTALLSPLSVAKKAAAVPGELLAAGLSEPDKLRELARVLGTPSAWKQAVNAGKDAFNAPDQEVTSGLENYIQKGPLSWSGRTMGGIVSGAKDLLGQAGYDSDAANYYTLSGQPNTRPGQAVLQAIRSSKGLSHFLPFSKLAINRIERGIDYSPLGAISALAKAGNTPEDIQMAIRKALVGSAIGYGAYQLTPEDYARDHPVATSLLTAAGGPLSIPLGIGIASKTSSKSGAAQAAKTMSRDIPGFETLDQLSTDPKALLPNYLAGYTNVVRPIATMLEPHANPDVSAKLPWEDEDPNHPTSKFGALTKMLANMPLVRGALPGKETHGLPALPHLRGRR